MILKVWQALEWTDWMLEDHDKLEVKITPRYWNDLTCSSWESFKKKEKGRLEKRETYEREWCIFLQLVVRWWKVIHDEIILTLDWTVDIEVGEEISCEREISSA